MVLLSLLAGCQAASDEGGGRAATAWVALAAEPWALLLERGGLWVVLSDHTLARHDPATGRAEGTPVRLPFTPGAVAAGHGDLWVGGQVDGRRRVTSEGSYPVIRVARVDPRRRRVTGVVSLPMRSNANQLLTTPDAVWVTDPAEGPLSRIWRINPATNRLLRPPLRGGEESLALAGQGGAVWSANHDDGTLRRMAATTGALQATVDLGVEPHGMALAPGAIWVADAHHRAVLRIDPTSGRTVARIPVGFEPGPLAATPDAVWVAGAADPDLPPGPVVRIDPASNRVAAEVPVDGRVTALAAGVGQAWAATRGPDALLRLPG